MYVNRAIVNFIFSELRNGNCGYSRLYEHSFAHTVHSNTYTRRDPRRRTFSFPFSKSSSGKLPKAIGVRTVRAANARERKKDRRGRSNEAWAACLMHLVPYFSSSPLSFRSLLLSLLSFPLPSPKNPFPFVLHLNLPIPPWRSLPFSRGCAHAESFRAFPLSPARFRIRMVRRIYIYIYLDRWIISFFPFISPFPLSLSSNTVF